MVNASTRRSAVMPWLWRSLGVARPIFKSHSDQGSQCTSKHLFGFTGKAQVQVSMSTLLVAVTTYYEESF